MDPISSWCAETELPAAPAAGQWVHLLPAGRFQGWDGRNFVLNNPQGVIAESPNRGDLPVDENHQIDDPEVRPAFGDVRAAGWIRQIEAREYRDIGPVMNHVPDERIARITGAGPVHRPNLMLKALSGEQPGAGVSQMAVAFGPPSEADTVTILTAVNPLRTPDLVQYVPADALADLLKDRHQHVALMSTREADAKVETALNGGYITPAMVPWATALCRQNPEAFDGFMQSSAPAYAHLFRKREFHNLPQTGSRERADAAAEIAAQLGLAPCLRTSAAASRGRSVNRRQ